MIALTFGLILNPYSPMVLHEPNTFSKVYREQKWL